MTATETDRLRRRRAIVATALVALALAQNAATAVAGFAAMRAGARGYVLKEAAPDNVVRAIEAVAAGEAIFGPG